MDRKNIIKLYGRFDSIVNIWLDSDVEFWLQGIYRNYWDMLNRETF